jgi:hypothetical protein
MDSLTACQFPPLNEPYLTALRSAVETIIGMYNPHGIVACGSIIRGNPDPTSDFDIYVIHDQPWRQRVQRWFNGVACEIFVNPPQRIEQYFVEERPDGRPMAAHMLATGVIVLDQNGEAARLQTLAQQVIQHTPDLSADALLWQRYAIATVFEDALDITETDPQNASLLLNDAVRQMLNYAYLSANRNIPRHKEIIARLGELNPEIEPLARVFFQTASITEQIKIAEKIADLTMGVRGFFEWESSRNEQ